MEQTQTHTEAGLTGKKLPQFTDTEVAAQVLSGNTALFEILIRRYNPVLYKIGRSYGYNHQDTEDLMQETFISSYLHLQQFARRSSFKTWIIRIMLNHCYHKSQKYSYTREKTTECLPDNSSYMAPHSNHSGNDTTIINRELKQVVEACIQRLPDEYRTTFALRELSGLSVSETAELMHTSAANVKVRLNRAKAMLRKEIEKTYTPEEVYEFNLVYCDRIVEAVMQRIHQLEQQRDTTPEP